MTRSQFKFTVLTLDAAKNLTYGQEVYHTTKRDSKGNPMKWRVSGKVQTWKRDPNRIRIPVKHGLYDNDAIEADTIASGILAIAYTEE